MWVSVRDIEDLWIGSQDLPASSAITAWIEAAEELVAYEFPDVADRIESEDLPLQRVKFVVSQMVLRVLKNPDNVTTRSFGVGSYQDSASLAKSGDLTITDQEREMLSGTVGGKAFAVDTVCPTALVHTDECSINFGATYCSCGAVLTGGYPLYGSVW